MTKCTWPATESCPRRTHRLLRNRGHTVNSPRSQHFLPCQAREPHSSSGRSRANFSSDARDGTQEAPETPVPCPQAELPARPLARTLHRSEVGSPHCCTYTLGPAWGLPARLLQPAPRPPAGPPQGPASPGRLAGQPPQHRQRDDGNERCGLGRRPLSDGAAGLRGPGWALRLFISARASEDTAGSQVFFPINLQRVGWCSPSHNR